MIYMADIIARRYLGHPISEFDYQKDKFGPYSPEIPKAIAELESLDLVWVKDNKATSQEGRDASKVLFDSGRRIIFDFSLGENEVLGYVVSNYRSMDLKEFIDLVVKKTKPFLAQKRVRAPLPMDIVDNEGRDLVGFELEAIIKAERQAEAGDFVTARDFFDSFLARLTARHTESH